MAKFKGNLPPEFPKLDELTTGYSIVIKGLPGTGKSSLALELVVDLPNSYYISTRIKPDVIMHDSPWIMNDISPKRTDPFFIDATRSGNHSDDDNKVFSSVLNFETIPEFIQQLFSLGSDHPNKVIVIDSWNALTLNLSNSETSHWESTIIQHLRAEDSKIIFILEGIQDSSLDWIVDGISVLNKRTITSPHGIQRRIRELNFIKMRGRVIQNENYLVTLSQGRFKTFYPFIYRFPAIMLKSKPISDPDDHHISSGSLHFDELLGGGFQKGSWNLFEVSTTVGDALDIILFPLLTNHLINGRPVISILREGVTLDTRQPYLNVFTGNEKWIENTVNVERYIPKETSHRTELPQTIEELLELLESSKQILNPKNRKNVLIDLGLDVLENKYGIPALNEFIAISVSKARLHGDIVVGFLKENQSFRGGTTAATSHWKIDLIDRALVLEGIVPATEYYAIESVLFKGYVDFTLTPII